MNNKKLQVLKDEQLEVIKNVLNYALDTDYIDYELFECGDEIEDLRRTKLLIMSTLKSLNCL